MGHIVHREEAYRIVGACFEVYNEKGCGFLEPVYQECLEMEFELQQIPFVVQPELMLAYRGKTLRQTYRPDFVCFSKVIVEIKAVSELADAHRAQMINYLNASRFELGLLINFGHFPKLEYERFVLQGKQAVQQAPFGSQTLETENTLPAKRANTREWEEDAGRMDWKRTCDTMGDKEHKRKR